MAKDFATGDDVNSDVGSDTGSVERSDFGGDLAGDNGIDLNADAQSLSKGGKRGLAAGLAGLGVVTGPFAPLHDQPTGHNPPLSDVPAIIQPIDRPIKTPEEVAAEMGATIEQGDTVDEIKEEKDEP